MRLIPSSVGTIWEQETSARDPLRIYVAFDCKEPLSITSVEGSAKLIREKKADCALIIHTGFKSENVEIKIGDEEKRIGKTGIIRTIPIVRRELDLLLMVNRIKDELSRKDAELLDTERLDKEIANIWSKLREEMERLVEDLNANGYILPKYDLDEHDALILLALYNTVGDESKAFDEYARYFFPLEFEQARSQTLPVPYISRVKERVRDSCLVNQEWKIEIPNFLRNILEELHEGKRKAADLLRRFILVDAGDLQKWLEYLRTLSVVGQKGEYWILNTSDGLKDEIEKTELKDPEDIDVTDEFEGTLRNFLAQFQYDMIKKKLEAIKSTFMQNIETYPSKEDPLSFIRNLTVYHALYMKGIEQALEVIQKAKTRMETSRSQIATAAKDIEKAEDGVVDINKKLGALRDVC